MELTGAGIWLVVYYVVVSIVPWVRWQRGYLWRLLLHVPPWRFVRGRSVLRLLVRQFFLILAVLFGVWTFTPRSVGFETSIAVLTAVELDDFFNGDDDRRKRRREWARNKIRWLMELPVRAPTRGTA